MDELLDTQSAILSAASRLLRQSTFEDISYLELAELAEVSERTIYRRFPTRSHLLEALGRWIEAEQFPVRDFRTPEEFAEAVRLRFRSYDAEPAFAFVAARGAALSPTVADGRSTFADAIAAMLRAAAPSLNRRDALRAEATLGYFSSPMYWARMRTGFSMSADEIVRSFEVVLQRVLSSTTSSRAA